MKHKKFPLAFLDEYRTPTGRSTPLLRYVLPLTQYFYFKLSKIVFDAASKAKKGKYDDKEWVNSSIRILHALEDAGCTAQIEGMKNLSAGEGPVVFIGNHMSTLETFILPCVIQPVKTCTFVIKPSLMEYPVFGHVMRSRNPIVVSRDNPRKDLITVLEEGKKKLESGISIILFPQTTRTAEFYPGQFNSLGVKLAKSAGVGVIPFALKTDAWGNGKRFKDFGKIDPTKTIHIVFGEPIPITGSGKNEHEQVLEFITNKLKSWNVQIFEHE